MSPTEKSGNARPHVLIAEDNQDFVEVLKIWLSEYGHSEVTAVTNGTDAVDTLDSTVDLFLCDQRMPGLTGPEVLERLDAAEYDVPTILISAYEPDFHGEDFDVEFYLSKPIDRGELIDAVDHILQQ